MSSTPTRRPVLPADWTHVLDQIQQGLDQAVAEAAGREQCLESNPSAETGPAPVPPRQFSADGLEELVRRAEQDAARAGAALEAGAEAARRWQEAAAGLRRRLAERASCEV
jgi:hypothetical protein